MKSYIKILSSGVSGVPASVLLFFDDERYLFNVGDGTQRFCTEHKIKMTNIGHIFLTKMHPDATGGLPGMIMTVSDSGKSSFNVHGGPGLFSYISCLSHFTRRFGFNMNVTESLDAYEDERVRIIPVVCWPKPSSSSCDNAAFNQDFTSRYGSHRSVFGHLGTKTYKECAVDTVEVEMDGSGGEKPIDGVLGKCEREDGKEEGKEKGKGRRSNDMYIDTDIDISSEGGRPKHRRKLNTDAPARASASVDANVDTEADADTEMKDVAEALPGPPSLFEQLRSPFFQKFTISSSRENKSKMHPHTHSPVVSYIIQLQDLPGKFNSTQAIKLGVKSGPLFGILSKGKSITLEDGTVIEPHQCMEPSTPGTVVIIVECPSLDYIENLIHDAKWESFGSLSRARTRARARASLLVHFTPLHVMRDDRYVMWMNSFEQGRGEGRSVEHVCVGSRDEIRFSSSCSSSSSPFVAAGTMQNVLHELCPDAYLNYIGFGEKEEKKEEKEKPTKVVLHTMSDTDMQKEKENSSDTINNTTTHDTTSVCVNVCVCVSVLLGDHLMTYFLAPVKSVGWGWGSDGVSVSVGENSGKGKGEEKEKEREKEKEKEKEEEKEEGKGKSHLHSFRESKQWKEFSVDYSEWKAKARKKTNMRAGMSIHEGDATAATTTAGTATTAGAGHGGAGGVGGVCAMDIDSGRMESESDIDTDDYELVFLGTGSALPSKYRNVSSILLAVKTRGGEEEREEKEGGEGEKEKGKKRYMLLDCGEGTYSQLVTVYGQNKADSIISSLQCVFLSHVHADHTLGLLKVLSRRRELALTTTTIHTLPPHTLHTLPLPLPVYGPPMLESWILEYSECCDDLLMSNGELCCEYHDSSELVRLEGQGGGGEGGVMEGVSEDIDMSERTSTLPSPSPLPWMKMLCMTSCVTVPVRHCYKAYGIVLCFDFGVKLNVGEGVGKGEGVSVSKTRKRKTVKIVYSGDCIPSRNLICEGKDADILIHEATFEDELQLEARSKLHSTMHDAVSVAKHMHAHFLVLTHFSQRYPKVPTLSLSSSTAQSVHTAHPVHTTEREGEGESGHDDDMRLITASDHMVIRPSLLPLLPRLLPVLCELWSTSEGE